MSYRVFISHSFRDSELARDLAHRLREIGIQVSTDEDVLRPGEDWRHRVSDRLSDADEVVLLLTDNAVANSNVIYEYGVADALDKRVTPVLVTEGVEQVLPMVGTQFVKYSDLPKYISSLKKRLKAA